MEGRKGRSTCGGADAAERDDPLAGDPEVAVREQAAPFAAQTLHARKNNKRSSASARHRRMQIRGARGAADLGEGRGVEERGRERRRHGQQRQHPSLPSRHRLLVASFSISLLMARVLSGCPRLRARACASVPCAVTTGQGEGGDLRARGHRPPGAPPRGRGALNQPVPRFRWGPEAEQAVQ